MSRSPRNRSHRYFLLALGLAAACITTTACDGRLGAPPVEITFRESLIGAGRIVLVRNITDQELSDVRITVTAPAGDEHAYQQTLLGAHQSVEVGWKKLGGWEIPAGAAIEVECSGYLLPQKARLPPE